MLLSPLVIVAAAPCALVISIPVSYVAAIGYRPVEYEMYGVDFHRRGAQSVQFDFTGRCRADEDAPLHVWQQMMCRLGENPIGGKFRRVLLPGHHRREPN